jgi:predicted aldo/keto reductase-like oxidoreductase
MRFPIIDNDPSQINREKTFEMLDYALKNGINYFDTAYPYHGGKSEKLVGDFFEKQNRKDFYLATKNPVWLVEKHSDFMYYLDEQLQNLKTNYIDFYLLHALSKKTFDKIKILNFKKFIEKAKKDKKINYIGFSFHDEYEVFEEIVDSYPWDFCQIQLNYMDKDYQAGLKGLEYAKSKGIDVVIMEPLKGGKLANSPEEINKIWDESEIKRTTPEWALKYLYSLSGISVVLSGMSTLDQLKENIVITAKADILDEKDLGLIDRAEKIYRSRIKVGCTSCNYCMPCPSGVKIPNVFELYNNKSVYGTVTESKKAYNDLLNTKASAKECIECGLCEKACPQNLSIISLLKEAHIDLTK